MHNILLDTGALVALLDRSEKYHEQCAEFFRSFRGGLLTTEAVLTEALYLLGPSIKPQRACMDFFLRGGATLVPQSIASLSRAADLIEKYHDVPMDFADATLVVLAEETAIDEVFTLDRRGFSVYRIKGKRAFTIRP